MSLNTKLIVHQKVRSITCCLCGRDWEEQCLAVVLYVDRKKLGSLCPICVRQQPRGVAELLRSQSALLEQSLLQVNQCAGNPGESSELSMQVAHARVTGLRMAAAAKNFLAKTGKPANDAADQRAVLQRVFGKTMRQRPAPKQGSADQIPLPSILTEHVEQAALETTVLRTVAEFLDQANDWTATLDKMIAAEQSCLRQRSPKLSAGQAREMVRERYERYLLESG